MDAFAIRQSAAPVTGTPNEKKKAVDFAVHRSVDRFQISGEGGGATSQTDAKERNNATCRLVCVKRLVLVRERKHGFCATTVLDRLILDALMDDIQ